MTEYDKETNLITIHIEITKDEYLAKIHALSRLLAIANFNQLDADTLYHGSDLLDDMLIDKQPVPIRPAG